jgi:hypothetical protein
MGEIGGILTGLLGALIGLIVLVRFIRRWDARRPPGPPGPREPVFGQAELYAMLNSGQITPTEFERVQALVLAQQPQQNQGPPPFAQVPGAPRGPRGFEPLPRPPGPAPDAGNPPAGR